MKIDISFIIAIIGFITGILINFGTILSYYWKIRERLLKTENRITNLENNNNNFSTDLKNLVVICNFLKEENVKMLSVLNNLQEKITELKNQK